MHHRCHEAKASHCGTAEMTLPVPASYPADTPTSPKANWICSQKYALLVIYAREKEKKLRKSNKKAVCTLGAHCKLQMCLCAFIYKTAILLTACESVDALQPIRRTISAKKPLSDAGMLS